MKRLTSILSLWAVVGAVLWVTTLIGFSKLAIPMFTNVTSGPCCRSTIFVEWAPLYAVAALVATVTVGIVFGVAALIRRR